jgi:hypothetical protein
MQADRSERSVGLIISGEKAFRVILDFFGWAKIPMAVRIRGIHEDVGMTLIYGGDSWIKPFPDEEFKQLRPASSPLLLDIHVSSGRNTITKLCLETALLMSS